MVGQVWMAKDIIEAWGPYAGMTRENTVLLVIDQVNSCAHERCEAPESMVWIFSDGAIYLNIVFLRHFFESGVENLVDDGIPRWVFLLSS